MKRESSNFAQWERPYQVSLGMLNYPYMGVVNVTWSIMFLILGPRHIFIIGEARHFKFGMQIDRGKY